MAWERNLDESPTICLMTIVRKPLLLAVMGTGLLLGALVHHRVFAQGKVRGSVSGSVSSPIKLIAALPPIQSPVLTTPNLSSSVLAVARGSTGNYRRGCDRDSPL
jgi:hypothetical protein